MPVSPAHIEIDWVVIAGSGCTVTFTRAATGDTQPSELVPVTENVAFALGATVKLPPETVYVEAPEGTMVKVLPVQMLPLFTDTVGPGSATTLMV